MKTESEAKFVDVDIDDVRARLEGAGAVLQQPMRDMRRALIEEPQHAAKTRLFVFATRAIVVL